MLRRRRLWKIDPALAEAHVSLGYSRTVYDCDLAAAKSEIQRALELNPNYPTAHQFHGYYLIAAGRLQDALAEEKKAQELDPLSPVITSAVGEGHYFSRQFDRAIEEEKKSLELNPEFVLGLFNLGRVYGRKGHHDQAIATLEQARSRAREDPGILAALGYEYGVSGRRPDAARTLALLRQASKDRYVPALYFVGICHLRGPWSFLRLLRVGAGWGRAGGLHGYWTKLSSIRKLLKHRDFIYSARRTWAPFKPAISAIRYKGITEMGLPQKNMRCRLALVVCLIGSVFNLRPGQGGMRWIDEHFDTSGTAGWVGPDFLH